jgi:rsbT co-antagonist protein RsbR
MSDSKNDRITKLQAEIATMHQHMQELEAYITQKQQSKDDIRTILDSVYDAVFIHDLDGTLLDVNQRVLDMYDVEYAQVLQLSIAEDLSAPDNPIENLAHIWQQVANGEHLLFEWKARRPSDGSLFDAEVFLRKVTLNNQVRVLATVRDITRHKEQERQLTLFKTLVDNATDGIAVADLNGTLSYVNDSYKAMHGYDDYTGKAVTEFIAEEDHPRTKQLLADVQEHGRAQVEMQRKRQDGSRFPTQNAAFLIYDPQGAAQAIAAIVHDMSEVRQAEHELHLYKEVIENAPDGIALANSDGYITYANPSYNRLLGYENAVGLHHMDITPADGASRMQEVGQHIFQEGFWQGYYTYQRKDSTIFTGHLSTFAISTTEDETTIIGAITRDVTEELRAEEERRALQQQVITAQQTAIRELSTPLIPLSDHVVLMPLVGSLDTQRVNQVMETLLEGIAAYQADIAIVDITGVSVVDTQVANALVQAAQAVQLLGAQTVLTGIGPAMAQSLVHLGANLQSIITRGRLQNAVEWALGR